MLHEHSRLALAEIQATGRKRSRQEQVISAFYHYQNRPLRDIDVLKYLFPGSDNLNLVRPRLSELHKQGILRESFPALSEDGRRKVRTSKLVNYSNQLELEL